MRRTVSKNREEKLQKNEKMSYTKQVTQSKYTINGKGKTSDATGNLR